jgi:outer membrane receptor for ferrienterochelin and colicins
MTRRSWTERGRQRGASRSWRQYGRTHNPLHYIDSQLNWRLGAHALAFGVQYKHEALRDDQPHR